ncbi:MULTISPECIES: Crp/Fnr family transcriptional regulator [unclassified Flavobacterium]|uniref:Crp/Fnr family transcriptional regulator n=1 Tax=unclassified Flavobacterium TaxID=196869 RepID=UPI00095CF4C0|nr:MULTISPECIES: Crp/Fnr family transcriptional regulator [unclassified Flavobacterium]MBN9284215.1 Crp/Fnr family transcriptional regulator [Flavobacterium sp.]OJV70702.1 MAG: cyclic nucleotide-binding protein [Flavobacterium sp. 40-81]
MEELLQKMSEYYPLSETTKAALLSLFQHKKIKKNDYLLRIGEVPKHYYFINHGLLAYYFIASNGDSIIKKFFAEHSLVASTSAVIQETPSQFAIVALEDCDYIQFPAAKFRALFDTHHDLAMFQLRYLEKNWVVAKENLEISLKYDTAKERYLRFLEEYKAIQNRIKQHHIASFLGITPTQLSRIRKELSL